jgi:hypothetical protein
MRRSGHPRPTDWGQLTYRAVILLFFVGLVWSCGQGGNLSSTEDVGIDDNQEDISGSDQDDPDELTDIDEPDAGQGETGEDQDSGVEPDTVEVLVMFLDADFAYATPVDIELNGQRHEFFGLEKDDPTWTTSLLDARGVVLEVEGPLSSVAFDPQQLKVDGLNVHGYGLFNYVIQKRHPDADLHHLSRDPGSLEHWSTAHDNDQIQWSRLGYSDGQQEVFDPDPEFYEIGLSPDWSDTGKISILVGGRGHHHPAFGPDEHPDEDYYDDPEPDPDPEPEPLKHPESPVLVPADIQVALTFLDGEFFDVALNGQIYSFSARSPDDPAWDYAFADARGQVIELDHELATMALDPAQIRVQGLNNEGYGLFGYKVVNKNADADLYQTNGNHDDNPEFWGNAATVDPLGIIVSRMGNTITGRQYPDPFFYYGLLDQQTGSRVFDPSWSATGKIGINFINYGENAPDPLPGYEDPWYE